MSAKLPPEKKLRSTGITMSREEKQEILEYVDAAGMSFAEYIRRLAAADATRRAKHILKIKAGRDGSKLPE